MELVAHANQLGVYNLIKLNMYAYYTYISKRYTTYRNKPHISKCRKSIIKMEWIGVV